MTALLIIAAVLVLLFIVPIGARVIYNENGVVVKVVFGLIRFKVVPGKPKKPKSEEEKAAEKKKKAAKKAAKKKKGAVKKLQKKEKPKKKKPIGALIKEFLPLIKLGLHALADLRKLPTIHKIKIRVTYGASDAAQAAMNYGLAWSIIGAGMGMLSQAMRIRKQDVQAVLDYECHEMRITADAVVTVTLWRLLGYGIHYGIKAIKILLDNKKKAVQQNESSSS
ncbi:MAG: DUF2953 domain-containing protein [Oscillospiraceae bacterium]|nr:DUF2953 domain-containing protein [Oscillospiraceae bacterium]